MRHDIVKEHDPVRGISIATLAREYPRGFRVPQHAHGSDQLIYASRGVMEVESGLRVWTVPPHFGLWIPARTVHQIRMPERVSLRTLYLRPGLSVVQPKCAVLHVSPLLRELILEVVRVRNLRTRNRVECTLRDLLLVQLERASPVPTGVTMPRDPRALVVARATIDDPGLRVPLTSLCANAGTSVRTLERAFARDVGIDFESWRRQARLMAAVELLVAGRSVKEVAHAVGYRQPTAFIALFKATFGTTPNAWISTLHRMD